MPLDTANTVLASAPYYDDYNESKNYHKILFRPSVPLQARELNQVQSILQNQIERFGDFVVQSGSIVKSSGSLETIDDARFISVQDNSDTENPDYAGATIVGQNTGVEAIILTGIDGYNASSRPSKFFVTYTKPGRNANGDIVYTFQEGVNGDPGEILQIFSETNPYKGSIVVTVNTGLSNSDFQAGGGYALGTEFFGGTSSAKGVIAYGEDFSNTIIFEDVRGSFKVGESIYSKANTLVSTELTSVGSALIEDTGSLIGTSRMLSPNSSLGYAATGSAYCIRVPEAIVYQKGFFVKTSDQILVVNATSGGAISASGQVVGYETEELVIDEYGDSTLYDNAAGSTNEAAPGAHRLQLSTSLVAYVKADIPEDVNFFPIAEFGPNGVLYVKDGPQFGAMQRAIAKRTYDESGNYTVKPFSVRTAPGSALLVEDGKTRLRDFKYLVSEGLAYVGGNEVQRLSESEISVDRGIDTASDVNQLLTTTIGDYIYVDEIRGFFPSSGFSAVSLYTVAQKAVSNNKAISGTASGGTLIGTANIRDFVYESGVKGSPTGRYKLYLIDIKMDSTYSFRDVRSVYYDDGSVRAFADVATNSTLKQIKTVSISSGGTRYVPGDIVTIVGGNGTPAYVEVETVSGAGVVATVSLYDGGSYVAAPSGTVSTSYSGAGTGLTITIGTIENKPLITLAETEFSKAVFPLSRGAVKNLKDADGASDTTYYFTSTVTANIETTGIANFDFSLPSTSLGWSDASDLSEIKIDLMVTGTANIETVNLTGTVTAAANATVKGSSTTFLSDFQVGEVIKSGSNSAVILAITDDTTLVVNGAITFGTGQSYKRVHPRGSIISLNTSKRDITNIDVPNASFSIDLGATTTASIATTAKVLLKKTSSSSLQKDVNRNVKVRLYEGQLSGKINGSGTTITAGDGLTKFQKELNVGNILKVSNQIRSITAIASNTSLTVNSEFSTAIVNASSNVVYSVVNPSGIWSLGFPDVFKINSIKRTSSIFGSSDLGPDLSQNFVIESGQRDTYYDHATLRVKNNSSFSMNGKPLIIDMDVLTVNNAITSGYFTVESYPIDDSISANTSTIKTWEIPTYFSPSAERTIDLRDVVDFRPFKTKTANLTSDSSAATVNPVYEPTLQALDEFATNTTLQKPYPGFNMEHNITYYLPRRDLVVVSNKGTIEVIKGTSGINPKYNERYDTEFVMPIARVVVPPYPSITTAEANIANRRDYRIKVGNINNRRFTMKDISAIEQRVSTLEYQTTLSMLEKSALSTPILGDDGTDRFKNGFFVDAFDNTQYADYSAGHNLVIDQAQSIGRPNYSLEYVQLEMSDNNADSVATVNDSNYNISFNKDFVTLSYTQEIVLQQSSASKELFLDNTVRYIGSVSLVPNRFADVEKATVFISTANTADTFFSRSTPPVIYPSERTIKFIARGLMPNARHWISIGNTDYSPRAVQGKISGANIVPENVIIDGLFGSPLYSDSEGVVYGLVSVLGSIPVGQHNINVTGKNINEQDQFSIATGGFNVTYVDRIPPPPVPIPVVPIKPLPPIVLPPPPIEDVVTPPPPPPPSILIADFDVEGALTVDETVPVHTLVFTDKTNRSVPAGYAVAEPTTYEWSFAVNGTSPIVADIETSSTAGPHTVQYTIPTKGETFTVKLKVSNATSGVVSEHTKQITLTRHVSDANPIKLTVYRNVPGYNNSYNLPEIGAEVKPSDGQIWLDFNSSRRSGNATFIQLSSTTLTGGISNTTDYFSYSGVGISEQTARSSNTTSNNNGNSLLSVKWGTNGAPIPEGELRVDVRYRGNNDIKVTRFITFTNTIPPIVVDVPLPKVEEEVKPDPPIIIIGPVVVPEADPPIDTGDDPLPVEEIAPEVEEDGGGGTIGDVFVYVAPEVQPIITPPPPPPEEIQSGSGGRSGIGGTIGIESTMIVFDPATGTIGYDGAEIQYSDEQQ